MGGYRMTSSAVAMSQDDWKRHYGPAWQTVQAAKTKFDPKNVLTHHALSCALVAGGSATGLSGTDA
jgi:FAD/FMN-containing dehydrogenase